MKQRIILAAVAATVATMGAGAASAQDWGGFYVGASMGFEGIDDDSDEVTLFDTNLDGTFGDTVRTTTNADAFASSPTTPAGFCDGEAIANNFAAGCRDDDSAEFGASLRAGYDMAFGGFIVGVVGDVGSVRVEDYVTGFSTTPANYQFKREIDDVLYAARVRAGVPFGNTLVYATGGYAFAEVEERYTTTNGANSFTPTTNTADADGFQVGLGVEHRLDDRVSLGLEYLYTDLSVDDSLVTRVGPGTAPLTNPFRIVNPAGTDNRRQSDDFTFQGVRLTMSAKF